MNGANLIPAYRRKVRARRAQVRFWSAALGIFILAPGGAYPALWSAWQPGGPDPAADAEKLARDIAAAEHAEKASLAKVKEAKASTDAAREVLDQPDWGALMVFVAGKLGPEAALDSIRLEPPAKTSSAAGARPPGSKPDDSIRPARTGAYTLVLTGVAKTQDAASNVAIDLKRTEVFAGVTLVESHRTGFMGDQAVAFRIDCAIVGAGGVD